MLERSKGAPLDVFLRLRVVPQTSFVTPAESLPQIGRIRSLQFAAVGMSQESVDILMEIVGLLQDWTTGAATLQELDLTISGAIPYSSLPKGFLLGGAPTLHTLKYHGNKIEWCSLPFGPNLVNLQLTAFLEHPTTPQTFVNAFAQMPLLQTLKLYCFLYFSTPRMQLALEQAEVMPVDLPSLRSLVIHDFLDEITDFLRLTRARGMTSMTLLVEAVENIPAAAVERTLRDTMTLWCYEPHKSKPPLRQITIGSDWGIGLYFDAHVPNGLPMTQALNHLIPSFTDNMGLHHYLTILERFFDFRTLSYLKLEGMMTDICGAEEWQYFAKLPGLSRISLDNPSGEYLRQFFLELQWKPRSEMPQTPPFPSLSSVTISNLDLDEDLGMGVEQFTSAFTAVLRSRVADSCPISKVQIVEHSDQIRETEVVRLREVDPCLTVSWINIA